MTSGHRDIFWRDGVVVLRDAATPEWVECLRRGIDSHLASPDAALSELSPASGANGRFVNGHGMMSALPELAGFLSESRLSSSVRQVFDEAEPVALIDDQVFAKAPSTMDVMPWHQDGSFWPTSGREFCTTWLALDDVSGETGGLEFVVGSHRWGRTFQAIGASPDPDIIDPEHEELPSECELRERHRVVCPEVRRGDALVFHAMTLHRSGPNTSTSTWRRAIVLRWAGGDARYEARDKAAPRARATAARHGMVSGARYIGSAFPEF